MYNTLAQSYFEHAHRLAIALAKAQQRGVKIDIDARRTLAEETQQRIEAIQLRINELVAKLQGIDSVSFNPNSPKQVQKLLYDTMKFPVVYNEDGRPTSNEDAILRLSRRYPDEEVLSLILSYRKDTKLLSSFLETPVDDNCIMHTSYNPSGTRTYRISSSQDLWGEGMNLQNIPVGKRPGVANIRHIFVARDGYSFIKGDLVQAETMVVARILCRYDDYTLWNKYTTGNFDVHRWAASTIYGIQECQVDDTKRSVGKVANHSSNYCAGPRVIQSTALKWGIDNIDFELAKRIIDTRRRTLPGLQKWWNGVQRKLQRDRTLWTCMGRRRIFFGRVDDNTTIRDAVAFEPQSTVGDVCNTIFIRLDETLPTGSYPVLQVHDEVVCEVKDDSIDAAIDCFKRAADVPLQLNEDLCPLVIPVEISVGKNWRDMEKVK